METTRPVPGPHLSAVRTQTLPEPHPNTGTRADAIRMFGPLVDELTPAPAPSVSFRELAKAHALRAAQLLDALPSRPDARDMAILEAQAHALVSQACSAVAPAARRELCRQGVDR